LLVVLASALIGTSLLLAFEAISAPAEEFKEGQVWSYRTRSNEGASTLLIDKIEQDEKLGTIYHISISGLSIPNSRAENGIIHELPHVPVSAQTLQTSCLKMLGYAPQNANFEKGYGEWKHAHDEGRAGIYTVSVAEIVALADKMLRD
jgi:hypothetical protein